MTLRSKIKLAKYVLKGIDKDTLKDDPIEQFKEWFHHAKQAGLTLPEAVAIATVGPGGKPSGRMMLLKGVDERGFRFFTNLDSRKGKELQQNHSASMVFHWADLQRQVRVEGQVESITDEEANEYFQSRPRGSRIGAWASAQSSELADRSELDACVVEIEERFKGQEVPLPPFWGGFLLCPVSIEFWQGRANRLHDRIVYRHEGHRWVKVRLSP
jgi:pyridoxamine 5'-phosphate oxidase